MVNRTRMEILDKNIGFTDKLFHHDFSFSRFGI